MSRFKSKDGRKRASATIQQIADRAGVSIGTVSNVLNSSATVSDGRKARVMDAVEALGFQPNQLARGLRRNATDMLGMLIPDIGNPFFPGVVRGAEDMAYKHGLRLVLCNTDDDAAKELSYLDDLRSFRPAGLLIIPSEGSMLTKKLGKFDPHVVFVDRCPPDWKGDFVMADNEGGGYAAGKHLLELGHRRIAVITGPLHLDTAVARLAGFKRALRETGVKLERGFVQEAKFHTESGFSAALRLLQLSSRPTAIFASNDLLASGALAAVRQLKLRCPEDVSIVGFDNLEFTEHTAPPLTTVSQSGYGIGETACRLLIERIKKERVLPTRVVLPTEMRIRNSTNRFDESRQPRAERKSSHKKSKS